MSVWNKYPKKRHTEIFLYLKRGFRKFSNDFSLTQLKDYIKKQHEKAVETSFKELLFSAS